MLDADRAGPLAILTAASRAWQRFRPTAQRPGADHVRLLLALAMLTVLVDMGLLLVAR